MKSITLLNFICCILFSCSLEDKSEHSGQIELDSSILNYAHAFVKEYKCQTCLNDITIDKIWPDSTIITIRTQTPYANYVKEHPVRQTLEIDGVPFYLYTGAEKFIKSLPMDTTITNRKGENCSGLGIWTIINSKGKNVYLKYGGEPFYYPDYGDPETAPKKTVRFLPPLNSII